MKARDVPPREGVPIFGYDLGMGRAWSAAVCLYRNGRTECLAVAPGVPDTGGSGAAGPNASWDLPQAGRLGPLLVADGVRVPTPVFLHGAAVSSWGNPELVMCDRCRFNELKDSCKRDPPCPENYPVEFGGGGYPGLAESGA